MDAAVDRYIRHSTILATDNSAHSWVSMLPRNVFPCKFNVTVGTLPSGMYIYTHKHTSYSIVDTRFYALRFDTCCSRARAISANAVMASSDMLSIWAYESISAFIGSASTDSRCWKKRWSDVMMSIGDWLVIGLFGNDARSINCLHKIARTFFARSRCVWTPGAGVGCGGGGNMWCGIGVLSISESSSCVMRGMV